MPIEHLLGGVILAGLIAYAVLGGADFGAGIWDAFARGTRRAEQRDAIARAMGPVWEANHVWLIFVIVLIFTGFPAAFAALSIGLFVPLNLVLLGIILRGAAFVFRAYSPQSSRSLRVAAGEVGRGAGAEGGGAGGTVEAAGRPATRWGAVFGVASVITPVLLGMCLGAVSAGRFRVLEGTVTHEGGPAWLAPLPLAMGAFALALCAYLAAVYLANETEGGLREDFRRRALLAGTAVVALSVLLLPLLHRRAPHLWAGLLSARALPVLTAGAAAALLSGYALRLRRYRLARLATIVQVACLVLGWGLAQLPYVIYPDVTLTASTAPAATLRFVLLSLIPGLALLLPSLWFLFRVFKTSPPARTSR